MTSKKPVKIYSQSDMVEEIETIPSRFYGDMEIVRIAFYTKVDQVRTRQVIALDGFYLNPLMESRALDKKDIPVWVQWLVDTNEFNPELAVTRQVKCWLVKDITRNSKGMNYKELAAQMTRFEDYKNKIRPPKKECENIFTR